MYRYNMIKNISFFISETKKIVSEFTFAATENDVWKLIQDVFTAFENGSI